MAFKMKGFNPGEGTGAGKLNGKRGYDTGGFEAKEEELGYIGMLHLWWTNEDNGIKYDNPRYFVKGTWHGEWLDRPEEGIEKAIQIQKRNTLLDLNKLLQVHYNFHQELRKREAEKEFNEETEEMAGLKSKRQPLN